MIPGLDSLSTSWLLESGQRDITRVEITSSHKTQEQIVDAAKPMALCLRESQSPRVVPVRAARVRPKKKHVLIDLLLGAIWHQATHKLPASTFRSY